MESALAIYGFYSKPRFIEPAGISYEISRLLDCILLGQSTLPVLQITPEELNRIRYETEDEIVEEVNWMDKDDEKYYKHVSKLDPNDFKDQDHYKILGLSKLRWKASMAQIKTAYRQKVLKYHPDKGKMHGPDKKKSEAIFACIQKAYEQLGLCEDKRRSFDSVDPTIDDTIPEASSINKSNFFELLESVFNRNSRFSTVQPVPSLGDIKADRDHVERFYDFWFNWSSWREFSYLDEEDKTKGEDRWERREIEKQNKVEREKRRKKEAKRILSLVELSYQHDPRIKAFKESDKKKKTEEKVRKQQEREERKAKQRETEAEEERKKEEERQKLEEMAKQEAQAKQQQKKALQTARRKLREVAKLSSYWTEDHEKQLVVMEHIERICITCETDELIDAYQKLELCAIYDEAIGLLPNLGKKETILLAEQQSKQTTQLNKESAWSPEELQLLIKATNLFPPGSVQRWQQVAKYIADHSPSTAKPKSEKEVIKQVKGLKTMELTAASVATNDIITKENKENMNEKIQEASKTGADDWSPIQQKQLEAGLKSNPSSDPDRWDKIAEAVKGKNKKQCISRYKYLAQLVKENKKA